MALNVQYILDRVDTYDITSLDTSAITKIIRQVASEVARKCPVYCWAALDITAGVSQYDKPTTSLSGRDLTDAFIYEVFWFTGIYDADSVAISSWVGTAHPDQIYHTIDDAFNGLRNSIYFKTRQGRFEWQDGQITLFPTPTIDGTIPILLGAPREDSEIDDDLNEAIANGVLGILFMRESTRLSQVGSFRAGAYSTSSSDHAASLRSQGKEFREAYASILDQWDVEVA